MSGGTELTTMDLGFIAGPILAVDDVLDNGNDYFYTNDSNVIADSSVSTVGFFNTKSDAVSFLLENSFDDCSQYFPE